MALETKLYQKLTQQLVMTPQLRMAIKILQVGRLELEAMIVDEMAQKATANSKGELNKKGKSAMPISKPDVLKLARGVEDALTKILWLDDAQIVYEVIQKFYGPQPGCFVTIAELPQVDTGWIGTAGDELNKLLAQRNGEAP